MISVPVSLVVVVPMCASLLIAVLGLTKYRCHWHISIVATFVSFIASLALLYNTLQIGRISYWLGGWEPPWGIEYVIDYCSGFVLVAITLVSLLTTVYAATYVKREVGESRDLSFAILNMLMVTGLHGIIVTGDLFNLYIFLEITSIAAYSLIGAGKKKGALVASFNYLILGTIGAIFVLIGVAYLYMITGTLNMADLRAILPVHYDSKVVFAAFAFITVGLAIKFALFPLHTWLLSAHSLAPAVVCSVLAASILKVTAYALIRVMFTVFEAGFTLEVIPATEILLVMSIIAIIVGGILTAAQTNLKRMLACSSLGQMGYIVLGVAIADQMAMTGSILHLLNHSLMKGGLFLIAGAIIHKVRIYDIADMKGVGRKMPLTMAAFTIIGLSMVGVPLTVGFVSKWHIAVGALKAGMWYIIPVIVASSLLTVFYFGKVIRNAYFASEGSDQGSSSKAHDHAHNQHGDRNSESRSEAPPGMVIPILIFAGLCIIFGTAAFIPVSIAEKAAIMLLEGT
ncbi:monovalent cation/H+ antiporter subunit D family protein [Thermodesulfovibrionales bacterium]|nr:monovalent cation/H+ antiporter subunit D family protein [Thermodesulfovibrionales bacterium]